MTFHVKQVRGRMSPDALRRCKIIRQALDYLKWRRSEVGLLFGGSSYEFTSASPLAVEEPLLRAFIGNRSAINAYNIVRAMWPDMEFEFRPKCDWSEPVIPLADDDLQIEGIGRLSLPCFLRSYPDASCSIIEVAVGAGALPEPDDPFLSLLPAPTDGWKFESANASGYLLVPLVNRGDNLLAVMPDGEDEQGEHTALDFPDYLDALLDLYRHHMAPGG